MSTTPTWHPTGAPRAPMPTSRREELEQDLAAVRSDLSTATSTDIPWLTALEASLVSRLAAA